MANWISSKLKAAESLLQQIDQQAADSLGKNEKPLVDGVGFDSPAKPENSVPLKDQLKKKRLESNNVHGGKFPSDRGLNNVSYSSSGSKDESLILHKEGFVSPKQPSPKPKTTLTDNDWTQLLGTPTTPSSGASARANGVSGIRGLRKDQRRQVDSGSGSSVLEGRRNQRGFNGGLKASGKVRGFEGNKVNIKTSDGDELGLSDSSGRSSGVKAPNDVRYASGRESGDKEVGEILPTLQVDKGNERNDDGPFDSIDLPREAYSQSQNNDSLQKVVPIVGNIDKVSEAKMQVIDTHDRVRRTVVAEKHETRTVTSRSSTSDDLKRGSSSVSYQSSDSDSGSGSSSDSEVEREREERRRRREKILAEKAAAKAVDAIKEKENLVARLEGEKQSLEKIFEEQTKQQAQEASKLQTSTMETMEAVELEKQKHNNTRMEVLAQLAKLETANAELARSLATMQWNLEVEVDRVTELRQQIDLKEAKNEELQRKISNAHQTGMKNITALKGGEIEQEILEAEYTSLTDKVRKLQDKAKKLEADIEMTRKEIEDPTEVEVELKRRLNQMTDHLIQKQTQVESLSSEKATIQFRIEAVSRMLDENKSMADYVGTTSRDLESGIWDLSDSKLKFKDKIRSSQKHLYSLLQQFDSIFLAGAVFLKRNPTAKLWSLVYLVCLHFWVIYILMSHSQPSYESKSGAVFSLENINNASTT